jgi:hypothetical protein
VGHLLLDGREGAAVEQVRRVHGVAGRAQLLRERAEAGRLPLGSVEQQHLGHGAL